MEIISECRPVARKRHICECCGFEIMPGMRYFRQFNKEDGEAWAFTAHEDCWEAALYLFRQDGGGYSDEITLPMEYENCTGEFPDYIRGLFPHVICRLELRKQLAEIAREKRLRSA